MSRRINVKLVLIRFVHRCFFQWQLSNRAMTHFLAIDDNPGGYKLEDILGSIRQGIFKRVDKILGDDKPEAKQVLKNNIKILGLLTESIEIAEHSTAVLDKDFDPSNPAEPRIGTR